MMRLISTVAAACIVLAGCAPKPTAEKPPAIAGGSSMTITSPAFANGDTIPKRFSAYGDGKSPELDWTNVPEGAKSFALICRDPDAPSGTFIHWVIFNIPATARQLAEGLPATERLPDGTVQGRNGAGKTGYFGPRPPSGTHHYHFDLYALDTTLALGPSATADSLSAAIGSHMVAKATLTGLYGK